MAYDTDLPGECKLKSDRERRDSAARVAIRLPIYLYFLICTRGESSGHVLFDVPVFLILWADLRAWPFTSIFSFSLKGRCPAGCRCSSSRYCLLARNRERV